MCIYLSAASASFGWWMVILSRRYNSCLCCAKIAPFSMALAVGIALSSGPPKRSPPFTMLSTCCSKPCQLENPTAMMSQLALLSTQSTPGLFPKQCGHTWGSYGKSWGGYVLDIVSSRWPLQHISCLVLCLCAFRLRRLARVLLHKCYWENSFTELVQRFQKEILPRDLNIMVLPRDLLYRSVQKSCQEVSYRDLSNSSFRDLVHRSCQETSYRGLAQRPGEERRGLARRSFCR